MAVMRYILGKSFSWTHLNRLLQLDSGTLLLLKFSYHVFILPFLPSMTLEVFSLLKTFLSISLENEKCEKSFL